MAMALRLIAMCSAIVACAASVPLQPMPAVLKPQSFTKMRASRDSALYTIELGDNSGYAHAPLLLDLHGTREAIGYDYAALLHDETAYTLETFLDSVLPSKQDQALLMKFIDWLWDRFLAPHTPNSFKAELSGMRSYYTRNGLPTDAVLGANVTADMVSQRFYTLANLPADPQNIIAMLEQELEQGWPQWLKDVVNDLISILEKIVHTCDAYGVWGSRTQGQLLYSSRNLDYNSNTGINKYKLVTFYHISGDSTVQGPYASLGFSFGLGALAGMSDVGLTTSEMNLDNSVVTFSGVPFPLRLRLVLEQGVDLQSAMAVWNNTNNTNSFNFLVASAPDAEMIRKTGKTNSEGNSAAYALETIRGYTGVFPADSPIERDATYYCKQDQCHKWTNQSGPVHIGKPLPEAVWRTNHGMNPVVLKTQEPLFNDTVFRYNLMHDIFSGLQAEGRLIDDNMAVNIVATLGIKGHNFLTCDQPLIGDNVMSIAYAPGARPGSSHGHLYIAWESGSGDNWRPAACSPYVGIQFDLWV